MRVQVVSVQPCILEKYGCCFPSLLVKLTARIHAKTKNADNNQESFIYIYILWREIQEQQSGRKQKQETETTHCTTAGLFGKRGFFAHANHERPDCETGELLMFSCWNPEVFYAICRKILIKNLAVNRQGQSHPGCHKLELPARLQFPQAPVDVTMPASRKGLGGVSCRWKHVQYPWYVDHRLPSNTNENGYHSKTVSDHTNLHQASADMWRFGEQCINSERWYICAGSPLPAARVSFWPDTNQIHEIWWFALKCQDKPFLPFFQASFCILLQQSKGTAKPQITNDKCMLYSIIFAEFSSILDS